MFYLYTTTNNRTVEVIDTYENFDDAVRDVINWWHEEEQKTILWITDWDGNIAVTIAPRMVNEAVVIYNPLICGHGAIDTYSEIEYTDEGTKFKHNGTEGIYSR